MTEGRGERVITKKKFSDDGLENKNQKVVITGDQSPNQSLKLKKNSKLVVAVLVMFVLAFIILFFISFSEGSTENDSSIPSTRISFDEIYTAYDTNELSADDIYKGNRYIVTAKINGIESGGLFNVTGGATLTMEYQVNNTVVFFNAEFEKEQEDALKSVQVGDTITFEGTCVSAGTWSDCELY